MERMKKFSGLLGRSKSTLVRPNRNSIANFDNAPADSPEANAPRAIRLFCESGSTSNGGEEVLHLPVIVESAESSPSAAASAAKQIRIFLAKDFQSKPHVQYNAIMLIRILSDNPGATFTRNFDKSFVTTVKELLRTGKDQSTQQILRETLDFLEADKGHDEGLQQLLQMWRKEKGQTASLARGMRPSQYQQPQGVMVGGAGGQQRNGQRGGSTQLPPPVELASRVEEAKNTAKILLQLVQSTPTEEFLNNELIREFSERCQSASRSMQSYINSDNPAPDHDTMQTLIETNEQLSLAMSKHQRAVLSARRALGVSPSPNNAETTQQREEHGAFAPPPAQQQQQQPAQQYVYSQPPAPAPAPTNGYGQQLSYDNRDTYQAPPGPPPTMTNSFQQRQQDPVNPFADPDDHSSHYPTETANYGAFSAPPHQNQPRHLPQPSQTFSIEVEPPQIPPVQHQDTSDLEDIYSTSPVSTRPSPLVPHASPTTTSHRPVSPQSPPRPGPGPWHNSDITPSYMGRQSSAANGLTMHGGMSDDKVSEIDGHSEVGRTGGFDRGNVSQPSTAGGASIGQSGYEVSPVETRTGARKVDIPGTGGFRNF